MENLSLRFVRWGAGLLVLGLVSGYGPLGHYLLMGTEQQCSWAPIHGHEVLLGWVGMTLFGLVYRALPGWSSGRPPALGLARAHFKLAVTGSLGVARHVGSNACEDTEAAAIQRLQLLQARSAFSEHT